MFAARAILVIGLLLSLARAQDVTVTFTGKVVNAATGAPVPHALIELIGDTHWAKLASVDGTFEFTGVPQGRYQISARKPGYFLANEIRITPGPAYLNLSPDTPPVSIQLYPEAIVYGRVEDENGDPAPHISVRLLQSTVTDGRKYTQPVTAADTNANGEFRIAGLAPGTYLAGAFSQLLQNGHLSDAGNSAAFAPAIFYPGARSPSGATPIVLTAGQHVELRFRIPHEQTVRLSGTLTGYPVGRNVMLLLGQDFEGGSSMASINFDQRTGAFHAFVVPGDYRLTAESRDADSSSVAYLSLHVSSDLGNIHVDMVPTATIPVEYRTEFLSNSTPLPPSGIPPARVTLISDDGQHQYTLAQYESGKILPRIENVPPGTYRVSFFVMGNFYVSEATWGTTDVLHNPLVLNAGGITAPISIVVRDDVPTLAPSVHGAAPGSHVELLIAAADGRADITHIRSTVSTNTTVTGLAPGDYYVWAFDTLDALEYRNPDVLSHLESSATRVTLSPGAKTTVELDLIHRGKS